MKLSLKSITMSVMILMLFTACNKGNEDVVYMLPEVKPITLSQEQRQMRDNNNEFACRLFRTVEEMKQEEGSTILSPISVTYLLGMLNSGADGETRQQITDVLGLGGSVQEINEYCKKMIEEAPNVDPSVTVQIANCIDVNSALGIKLLKPYTNDMKNYYHAQIEALDFNKNSSLDKINNWCSKNTDGMIPTILDELNPYAAMYLLNAIYFKATWTEKFDSNDTRDMDFTKLDGTTTKRQMMHRKAIVQHGCDDLCSTLCLPYGNNSWSMYVLLPNEDKTVEDILQDLSAQSLNEHIINTRVHEVDILMPRFSTATETMLKDVLSSMGMPLAFDANKAEFPNMAEGYNLFVSMMKQKAKIDVDEQGTKASAVTIAEMGATSAGPQQYEKDEFHATRPFVYLIMEESTRTIFFIGTYCGD